MREITAEIFISNVMTIDTYTIPLPINIDEFQYEWFDSFNNMYDDPEYYNVRGIDLGFIDNIEDFTLDDLNDIYYKFEEFSKEVQDNYEELCLQHFNSFNDLYESKDNLIYYEGINSAEELGMKFLIDGYMGDVPELFYRFVDFEALGKHIEENRKLIKVADGMFEVI